MFLMITPDFVHTRKHVYTYKYIPESGLECFSAYLVVPLRILSNRRAKGTDRLGLSGTGSGLNSPPGEFTAMVRRPCNIQYTERGINSIKSIHRVSRISI
jgi:hypothetical protein